MLQVQDISFRIGNFRLLESVSFEARPGELLIILGANGAGKSTLLKIIRGELSPGAGNVQVSHKPLQDWKVKELALCMAVLQQQTLLNLPFSVREVVTMGRYPHFKTLPGPEDHRIVEEALQKAGVAHLIDRNYLHLSGGEQQRVHLARVFAQVWHKGGPQMLRYLLMDEPGNNLDISHQHNALVMAKEFAASGNCAIAILHDLNLAFQYADRILLMHQGRTLAYGTPGTVLTDELVSEAYGFPLRIHRDDSLAFPIVLPASQIHQLSN